MPETDPSTLAAGLRLPPGWLVYDPPRESEAAAVATTENDLGRTIVVQAGQPGPPTIEGALEAVQEERERLAAWSDLDDANRHLVLALVRSSLRRLLDSAHWIPDSVRLGDRRLDISIVVELDATQVQVHAAAVELEREVEESRRALEALIAHLGAVNDEDGAHGSPA